MKNIYKLSLALLTAFSVVSCSSKDEALTADTEMSQEKQLRHVVMFQFKADATAEQITKIEQEFGKLPSKIDGITDYEWGTNISKEGKDQGFTHCFIVTFQDQADLDAYAPHPAHLAFVEILKPSLEKVLVVDFFTK